MQRHLTLSTESLCYHDLRPLKCSVGRDVGPRVGDSISWAKKNLICLGDLSIITVS